MDSMLCQCHDMLIATLHTPVLLVHDPHPVISTALIFSLIHSSLNFPLKHGKYVTISSMMLAGSSPPAARSFSSASCSSVQQSGFLESRVEFGADLVSAGVVGLVGSGLELTMMMGYWYSVVGKWRDWSVKIVV
jgi:hypothetical protein